MEGHEKQTTIYGIVCAEPICRTTPLGRTVTSLIIAISEKEYISCIFRGKMHVNAADQISVTGNMELNTIYAMAYNASKLTEEGDQMKECELQARYNYRKKGKRITIDLCPSEQDLGTDYDYIVEETEE